MIIVVWVILGAGVFLIGAYGLNLLLKKIWGPYSVVFAVDDLVRYVDRRKSRLTVMGKCAGLAALAALAIVLPFGLDLSVGIHPQTESVLTFALMFAAIVFAVVFAISIVVADPRRIDYDW